MSIKRSQTTVGPTAEPILTAKNQAVPQSPQASSWFSEDNNGSDRRNFLQEVAVIILGALLGGIPAGAGLIVLSDPLRLRRREQAGWTRITSVDAVPADGVPRKFPAIATRMDAWNRYPGVPVGAVYLRRTEAGEVQALNVMCPHAGCFVNYAAENREFRCPCHGSTFTVDGQIKDPASPSPRALDRLAAEVRERGEIWVEFQNFSAGRKDKVPLT